MKKFLAWLMLVGLCLTSMAWSQKVVLGVEANGSDQATISAYNWRKTNVYEKIYPDQGFRVILISQSNKSKVEEALRTNQVTHITGCGHGSSSSYTGYNQSTVFSTYDTTLLKKLAGIHVHLLSCQTAQKLGLEMVKNGAASYAGYYPNFTFTWKSAHRFFEADASLDQSFANGKSAPQAYSDAVNKFNEVIEILKKEEPDAVRYLVVDRDGLRCYPQRNEEVEEMVWDLPLEVALSCLYAQDRTTGEFVDLTTYRQGRSDSIAFGELSDEVFQSLVVSAYEKLSPDFALGILSHGIFQRDQLLQEVRSASEVGQILMQLEKRFLGILLASRYTKVIEVTTDAEGNLAAANSFEAPFEVTATGMTATWTGEPRTFSNVHATLNNDVMLNQKVQSGTKYSFSKKVPEGTSVYKVNATGGPKNTKVTVTIYIDIWK